MITPDTRDSSFDNPYWEGNLNEKNETITKGYDIAVKQVDNAIDNLECIDTSELNTDQIYYLKKVVEDGSTRQKLREYFLEYLEIQRNSMVVAMIENQPDEEESINVKELKEQMEVDPTY